LQRHAALLLSINKVFREAIVSETEEDLARMCLAVAEELTGSRFGFIGELHENGLFYDMALSNPGWEACTMHMKNSEGLGHNMVVRGIWGRVLLDEKPVIANTPSSHPDRIGLPEGHPPLTSFMGVPLKNADRTFGMIALGNKEGGYGEADITAIESLSVAFAEALLRKRSEERLKRSHQELEIRVRERTAELERSNQALQDFAFIASHDMQEPLRKVKSFGCRLVDKCGPSLGDEGKDYLNRMLGAAERMQNLLDALLSFSRVSSRAEPFKEVNLEELMEDVISDLEARIEETGGLVEVGDLPTIEADESQMHQLLQNLIGNALKYHKENEAPVVKVHGRVEQGTCQVIIEDNGIGFDEMYLDRIFKPLQRLHGRGIYEGTGMGLAICRRIVKRHGGSITAKSKPGEGSTFVVILPLKQTVAAVSDE
jgi:signal transduction histidine kinase